MIAGGTGRPTGQTGRPKRKPFGRRNAVLSMLKMSSKKKFTNLDSLGESSDSCAGPSPPRKICWRTFPLFSAWHAEPQKRKNPVHRAAPISGPASGSGVSRRNRPWPPIAPNPRLKRKMWCRFRPGSQILLQVTLPELEAMCCRCRCVATRQRRYGRSLQPRLTPQLLQSASRLHPLPPLPRPQREPDQRPRNHQPHRRA